MKNTLKQAYSLVPWRGQMQWIGLVLVAIVGIALIAWLYLSISAQAGITGRDIQSLRTEKNKLEQSIAQLETDLAMITSSTNMAQRANRLGYKTMNPNKFVYLVIEGYNGRPTANLSAEELAELPSGSQLVPEFTQSLWDWMYLSFVEPSINQWYETR